VGSSFLLNGLPQLTGAVTTPSTGSSATVFPVSALSQIISAAAPTALGTSGAVSADLSVNNQFTLTATGNVTLTVANSATGSAFAVLVSASAYTVTWSLTGLVWAGGAAPTLPTTAGRYMIVAFKRYLSGVWVGVASPECY